MKYNSPIHSSPPPETRGREAQKKYLRKDGSEGSEGTDGACKMITPNRSSTDFQHRILTPALPYPPTPLYTLLCASIRRYTSLCASLCLWGRSGASQGVLEVSAHPCTDSLACRGAMC